MSSPVVDGTEDVHDFLQRIKEIGIQRNKEDEEQNRKLEEAIIQGRKERQARRAERARSISPTKKSPVDTFSKNRYSVPQNISLSVFPQLCPTESTESGGHHHTTSFDFESIVQKKEERLPSETGTESARVIFGARQTVDTSIPSSAPTFITSAQSLERNQTPQASDSQADCLQSTPTIDDIAKIQNQTSDLSPKCGVVTSFTPDKTGENLALGTLCDVEIPNNISLSPTRSQGVKCSPTPLNGAQNLYLSQELHSDCRSSVSLTSPPFVFSEKLNRSASPTKGMGGFVQSAMMRRNDSVNKKRWSVNSSPSISKSETTPNPVLTNKTTRPSSSHDRTIATLDTSETSSLARANLTTFSREGSHEAPTLSNSRFGNSLGLRYESPNSNDIRQQEMTPPSSPLKPFDRKRWSPTKSSWLEAALNKPDVVKQKPKATPLQQQPAWMSGMNKSKLRASTDNGRSPNLTPKHEVNIGGLMRSRPTGGSLPVGNFPVARSFGPIPGSSKITSNSTASSDRTASFLNSRNRANSPSQASPTLSNTSKIDISPQNNFRANLRTRKLPSTSDNSTEPDLKTVFVQLRPTKTQNYVAPDELKDNITKGKASLNITGGPRKIERKDEFKEAILRKKEDFKKAQLEGKGVPRSSSKSQEIKLPEALIKQKVLGRSNSISSGFSSRLESTSSYQLNSRARTESITRVGPTQVNSTVKVSDKIHEELAGLLTRNISQSSVNKVESCNLDPFYHKNVNYTENPDHIPQLTHMTKQRARGPRRKPPSKQLSSILLFADLTSDKHKSMSPSNLAENSLSALATENQASIKTASIPSTLYSNDPKAADEKYQLNMSALPIKDFCCPEENHISGRFTASEMQTYDAKDSREEHQSGQSPFYPNDIRTQGSDPSVSFDVSNSKKLQESNQFTRNKADLELSPVNKFHKLETREDNNKISNLVENSVANQSTPPLVSPIINTPSAPSISEETSLNSPSLKTALSISEPDKTTSNRDNEIIQSMTLTTVNSIPEPIASDTEFPPKSVSQYSDSCIALTKFFDRTSSPEQFNFDTLDLLSSNLDENLGISTQKADIFLYSNIGQKQCLPSHQERILFEEEFYLCVHTFKTSSGKISTEVFLWIGDETDKNTHPKAESCAQREAKAVGGNLVIIRQGKETSQFFSALGGFIIIQRGNTKKYNSLEPHILCARNCVGHIAFDEMDFCADSLCSGFSYLISTQSLKCYLWKGKGTSFEELMCAKLVGMNFGLTGEIEEVEDGKEPVEFMQIFGKDIQIPKSADYWELKPKFTKYRARLFSADANAQSKITETKPFSQCDLNDQQKIYILDVFFEIYIIIGSKAQSQYSAFHNALTFAQEYSILAAGMEERPYVPAIYVILEGIPRDLKAVFRKWSINLAPNCQLQRNNCSMALPLTEVLEALRN